MAGGLASGANGSGPEFNAIFLAYLIVCGALSVFFLLYFNRVFASLVSWGLRAWTWHRYRIYIDIQALQFSLLGGRIFFTGLRYHGNNETILVQNGYITWAYWLRRVREVDLADGQGKDKAVCGDGPASPSQRQKSAQLPCRISVNLVGLEWFVYNRSAAYDTLLSGMTRGISPNQSGETPSGEDEIHQHKLQKRFDGPDGKASMYPAENGFASDTDAVTNEKASTDRGVPGSRGSRKSRVSQSEDHDDDIAESLHSHATAEHTPFLLQFFPIDVYCEKAAVVMGNENTQAILIVKTKSMSGEIGASATETSDPYRQIFNLKFERPVIEIKENEDFVEDQVDRASRERQMAETSTPLPKKSFFHLQRRRVLGALRNMIPYWRSSVESLSPNSGSRIGAPGPQVHGAMRWQGLSRYLDDDEQDEKARWSSHEYAAVPTILDSPEASLSIYWDVPGRVARKFNAGQEKTVGNSPNINGDEPPAWGISLSIKGGSINYGPWADRQRGELQRMFFPTLCKDAMPTERLPHGAYRLPTQFKLYVELEEDVTVRIPVRENSKNWRYKGKAPDSKVGRAPEKRKSRGLFRKSDQGAAPVHHRPYGWLDIKIAANATVAYSMDMVATAAGFSNTLNLDLPKTEISSSINHELLWRSGSQKISCDLSTPLKWNGPRLWYFDVVSSDLELFLLRDHVFLLTDLVDDWASGPPAEYLTFTPFKYFLGLNLQNVKLYLNVNDSNIIDDPTDLEDNTFIIISSPLLKSTTCIPIDEFRPPTNAVPFDVRAETASVSLNLPTWNTQATFVDSKDIGHVENLCVEGKYHYHATTSAANTDTLILNLSAQSPSARLYGFVIRYFLKVKDNYFGDDVHFKTFEEYQDLLRLKESSPDVDVSQRPSNKKSNDLDVMLNVRVDDPKVSLPANLYSATRSAQLDAACLTANLRFTNYYMDLDLNLSPLSLSPGGADDGMETPKSFSSSTQLFIDGIHVYGSRLFGLPPSEPTYLCNWDFSVGAVTGECTPEFLTTLARAGKAFTFTFDDDENALVPYSSIVVYDVTFLRAFVQSVRIWLHAEDAAFLLSTGPIDVNYNDWARTHYSKRANIRIPDLQLSCVNSESAARHKSRPQHIVETEAFVKTDIHVAIIGRKFNFKEERRLQQELLRRHDQRTHRAPFLRLNNLLSEFVPDIVEPPAQPIPPIPQPTSTQDDLDGKSFSSAGMSVRSRALRHKSSFLTATSSSMSSIVKQSSKRSSLKSKYHDSVQPLTSLETASHMNHGLRRGRDVSGSTTQYSASHSVAGDYGDRRDPLHNTLAFSSQYFAPYFPLESIRPDPGGTAPQSIEDDETPELMAFSLEDIDPEVLAEDCMWSSTLVELPRGFTAILNQSSIKHAVTLLSALQPVDPQDVLDTVQSGTITAILDRRKEQKAKGHIKDLVVRLPHGHIKFTNTFDLDSVDPRQDEQDQYDFSITKMALLARFQTRWEDAFDLDSRQSRDSFHLNVSSLELSASEQLHHLDEPQAAVTATVSEILVSMGSKDVNYLETDIGGVRVSTSSEKVEYLASLVHRTSVLGAEFGDLFSEATSREDRLCRYLSYNLVIGRQAMPDPSFLARPSAVLRSASAHLRTSDSWKLAIRLRQMWSELSSSDKNRLRLDCITGVERAPGDARQQIVDAFKRWRSWDLDYVSDSVLLNYIFGRIAREPTATKDLPLLGVIRIREVRLCLDPGPRQNEIWLRELTTRLQDSKDLLVAGARASPDDKAAPNTLLNIQCADAAVNMNWDLCELADDILKLYNKMSKEMQPRLDRSKPESTAQPHRQTMVHAVLVLGQGSIALDTVNLNVRSLSSGMKVSFLHRQGLEELSDTNIVLNCDAVSSRIRSHSQTLAEFQLRDPTIIMSHGLKQTGNMDLHTIKASASSQKLSLAVRQDPLVLMEVLDLLVRDEAAQLYSLKQHLSSAPQSGPRAIQIADRLSNIRINAAMFLNEYSISVQLLRSLTYQISGVVARVAMAANFGKELIVDFDIKENSHEMHMTVNNALRSISLLQFPPTNGRVTSVMDQGEHIVTALASLELVQLDASAVYSLLTALNRPEISNAIDDLQHQAKALQGHISEIFGGGESEVVQDKATESSARPVYSIHLTFAGLEVFGDSPLQSEAGRLAHVSFLMDSVHLELANRVRKHGPIFEQPAVYINLRQISCGLQRGTPDSMCSCGSLSFEALLTATTKMADDGSEQRYFDVQSDEFQVYLSPETVSTAVDVLGYMGDKIKDIDTSRELEYLRKLRQTKPRIAINDEEQKEEEEEEDLFHSFLSSITYSFELRNLEVTWMLDVDYETAIAGRENLVLSLQRIELGTKTRNSARLTIENLQGQMVAPSQDKSIRSQNSALLPEIIFNIAYLSTPNTRRLAFQAVGKSLDLRLNSGFIIPAANLHDSIGLSVKNVQQASQKWGLTRPAAETTVETQDDPPKRNILGSRRLESLLIDADFAGAMVHLTGKRSAEELNMSTRGSRFGPAGKYGQFNADESGSGTTLRTPGLAWKLKYSDNGKEDPALYAEIKIDASSNILYPSVVPLVRDMSSSIKEIVRKDEAGNIKTPQEILGKAKTTPGENILTVDPSAVLGRMRLNLGLRICRQEFSLSCQPIARVAATTSFEDVYFTLNTVRSLDQGNFFAISGAFSQLRASVQHVYSRESTGSFAVDSIVVSLMNSKHVSGTSGLSAILKVSPMKVSINAKQMQDFLLFREIWAPTEIRQGSVGPVAVLTSETSQGHLVQRYQQVAATGAFPWTATISISGLEISVDLGQAIGRSVFLIEEFWVSSKKTSDWEQNMCLGFRQIGVESTGRMGGFVTLQDFKLRTSIQWPHREQALNETPLVQAAISFSQLRVKAAFDYQAFLISDITSMRFLMYNVRRSHEGSGDRLVAFFEGDAVQVFGTTTSAAQAVALYQAFQKLVQERRASFEASVKEIEKFLRRSSVAVSPVVQGLGLDKERDESLAKSPISLDTDVVVTLKALNLGVFPNTFSDNQVFKMEALNAQARFIANIEKRRIHSVLGLTLGQLRIGLAGVRNPGAPKAVGELTVEDVVHSATGSRGGTILKVPRVEANMQTWQSPDSRAIDYIFKSAFEGKVEVGWNYSRISYIRGMWATHSKALAQATGRELPLTAIKVTGVPEAEEEGAGGSATAGGRTGEKTKITAEVHVPQSKYEYRAIEPPVIETPQLRDMGEATPPLEWIGLHRDRLPNLTHQIVIVALLELAGEVEDAYSRILGSS